MEKYSASLDSSYVAVPKAYMDHSSKPKNIKSLVILLTEHIEKAQYVIAITRSSRVNNITLPRI